MKKIKIIYSLLFSMVYASIGWTQSGSFGNTHIGAGAEMSIINAQHNFLSGGGGVQPGIVSTERTVPKGYLSFVGTASHTGASNTAHVDGYVKTYQTSAFTFPIGDNGMYRPASVSTSSSAAPTDAAYYRINPTNDGYTSTSVAAGVVGVSTVEYWDINGTTPAQITLTWDNNSGVTSGAAMKIVGWNGSQWVDIPATVTGGSTTTAGAITTNSSVTPNTYTVYTLAGVGVIPAAGAIDCSKTQVFTAPIAGQAGQKTLIVSINVTTPGCFSPITVNGSGMTVANGVTQVCTTTTGVQNFSIPVNYDGTALGTMNFTIGAAGTCSADLTKTPKKAISDIWTLDCVPTVGPTLK